MNSFPIWKYHKTLCPDGRIIRSSEEDSKLSKDWVLSPADFDAVETPVIDTPKVETPKVDIPAEAVKSVKPSKFRK